MVSPKQEWLQDFAEEERLPLVEYEKHGQEYVLYSVDPRAVKALGLDFVYLPETKRYEVWVDALPKAEGVELNKLSHRIPTAAEQAKFADAYKKYQAKKAVLEKLEREIEKDEANLVKMLGTFGLCLKPGSRDRRLVAGQTLVHHMEAIIPSVDDVALRKLAKKHPELKKVFKEEVVEYIDREALKDALTRLPGSIAAKVMCHDSVMSFNERPIKKPEPYIRKLLARVAALKTDRKSK